MMPRHLDVRECNDTMHIWFDYTQKLDKILGIHNPHIWCFSFFGICKLRTNCNGFIRCVTSNESWVGFQSSYETQWNMACKERYGGSKFDYLIAWLKKFNSTIV